MKRLGCLRSQINSTAVANKNANVKNGATVLTSALVSPYSRTIKPASMRAPAAMDLVHR